MSEWHDPHGGPAPSDGERPEAGPPHETGEATNPASGGERAAGGMSGDERSGLDLDSMDEEALRDLLRASVRDLEPAPDALEHLRRAVPARRARRRHALVGAAAAVLVCAVAVPAALHADIGPDPDKSMRTAGHAQDPAAEREENGGADQDRGPAVTGGENGPAGTVDRGAQSGAPATGGSAGPAPSSSLGPVSPTCTRAQLGYGEGAHGEPDAQGRVYGSFTVVNTSEESCTVEGDGIVLAAAQGGAKSTMIQVVDHTTGDDAVGLPDPATAADEVVLEPDAGYVVEFAWVPREGGGSSGCATSSPTPGGEGGEGSPAPGAQRPMGSGGSLDDGSDAGGTGGEGGDGTDTGSGDQGGASGGTGGTDGGSGSDGGTGDEPTPPEPSVVVSHTPDVGDPVAADVVLEGACAGTLYRTGVLPAA